MKAGGQLRLPVRLALAGRFEELSVGTGEFGSTDPNANASAVIFEGDRLNMLSDDAATLQQQLTALAGPSIGGGAQFLINGFSGGRIPPKSSIRSIRINGNSYSAYYDSLGFNRIEIQTRPGADKLHGSLNFIGTDQPLNARNPYAFGLVPPYYEFQSDGNLNGPISKKTSFFAAENILQLANNAVVNAIVLDPSFSPTTLSQALPAPQHTNTFSLRLDHQFSPTNFGYLRDEWSQNHVTNSGISPLILPEAAFAANTLTNTLQGSDTQVLGAHAVNEVRFQYSRSRARQDPNSTATSLVVQGALQAGGNPSQLLRDNQDRYELQDLVEFDRGTHSIRTGFRFRELRDSIYSSANYNGEYVFGANVVNGQTISGLNAYEITERGLAAGLTAAQIRALGGGASQFNITVGTPKAVLWNADTAFFAEDDWRAKKDLTFSYGLRVETESGIPDHFDPAPRIGLAWAIHRGKNPAPFLTLRTGYGIFYDRFPAANLLQALRQNGTSQIAYFLQNPDSYPAIPPPGALTASQPTIYRVNPQLRSSYQQAGSIAVDRTIGHIGIVSTTFLYGHGSHEFLLRNINAPLPGTYNPADPNSGTRPLGTLQNIYQYSSDSNENSAILFTTANLQLTKSVYFFSFYTLERQYNESDGSTSFPSNQYDLRADYARAQNNHLQTLFSAFIWKLPHGFQIEPFLSAHSGAPFNITTGTDLNGDTIFNDRPSFATDLSRPSVVRTAFGNFDTAPITGQRIIPRNYGNSPGYIWLDIQASKSLHIGPRPAMQAARPGPDGKPSPAAGKPDRPWELKFQVEAENVLNHNNPGLPIGVLPSPGEPVCAGLISTSNCSYFGKSLSLANDFSPLTSSNRTFLLQSLFTF